MENNILLIENSFPILDWALAFFVAAAVFIAIRVFLYHITNDTTPSYLWFRAARYGCYEEIERLLKEEKIDIDMQDANGDTALSVACLAFKGDFSDNHTKVVRELLEHNANPNIQNKQGKTPLIIAARGGCFALDSIQLLLKYKANINHQDNEGKTALIVMVEKTECTPAMFELLKQGADSTIKCKEGYTALSYAEQRQCKNVIRYLQIGKNKFQPQK